MPVTAIAVATAAVARLPDAATAVSWLADG
jgi:hypothetical protein